MNIFQTFWFQYPLFLAAGAIICVVWFLYYFFRKQEENFVEYKLLAEVYKRNNYLYNLFLTLCFLMTFLFFVYLANPYMSEQTQKIKRNGIDIEIVFDLSYSMIANDILPNRLQAAKSVLSEFISQVENDRVWLVLFSWKPFQSIPLTYDYSFIESFISDLEIDTINQQSSQLQGTAIWDGLIVASDALSREENEREKVIILLTDGEANKWIDPELALKYIKEEGIKVYTIWVGKQWDTTIELPTYGGFTQRVSVSWVDEEILQKIASETWWFYGRADSQESFQKILSTIATLEKKEIETQSVELQSSLRFMVLMLMLLSLFPLIYITFRVQIWNISQK